MGGERWVLFSSRKQADAARAFFAPLRRPGAEGDTAYGYVSLGDESGDCWLSWTSPLKLEIGYSFGNHDGNSAAAEITAREIARRFKIRRIGADSTGWYPDKQWESTDPMGAPARYGAYKSWAAWVKEWTPKWSFTVMMIRGRLEGTEDPATQEEYEGWLVDVTKLLNKVEIAILDQFKALDEKAA